MSNTIYIIQETISYDPFETPDVSMIGYCETREEAEKICLELRTKIKTQEKFFREFGRYCEVGCNAWQSDKVGEKKAKKSLENCRKNGCPKADLYVSEVLYGDDKKSGGLEVRCKNKADECISVEPKEYEVIEVKKFSVSKGDK